MRIYIFLILCASIQWDSTCICVALTFIYICTKCVRAGKGLERVFHLSSSSSAFPSAADQIRRLKYFRNAVIASNGSVSPDLGQYRLI